VRGVDVLTRDEQPADGAAVAEVVRRAFGDEGEQVAALWADLSEPDVLRASLVAEVGGEVVGHVALSAARVDARRALVDVLVLSPLSVLPRHQGAGVGTALVVAALERAGRLGAPALFVEGSPAYYGPRGFGRGADHGFAPASVRTPDRAFQVALLDGYERWMTGRLVYPDVWWRHDAAGLRDPALAELEEVLGRSS
jgi:putative acetyltransferase